MKRILNALNFKKNWKLLLITLVLGFLMRALPMLGIKPEMDLSFGIGNASSFMGLTNPQPQKPEVFDSIKPKLEHIENSYQVKQTSFTQTLTNVIPESHAASEYEEASGYVVVDFDTGDVLAEKNIDQQLAIASITKVMTAVVALDLASSDEKFKVSKRASRIIPTKIGVVPDQEMTLDELLNASLLTSANDAVQVIKEGIDQKYGEPVFIKAMNEKAKFLDLKETSFENAQGFDGQNHHSSPRDLAVLSHYALTNYPLISDVVKKQYQFLAENSDHKQFDLYNWNGLLGVYPGASGIKIGNTGDAGRTTTVVAEREGKKILVVLLGAPGTLERDLWAAQLLDLGFEKTLGLEPVNITEEQLKEKYATWKYFD